MVIHPREQDLIIGTFGRAAWVLDDIKPLRAMAGKNISDNKITLFVPPVAYQAANQQPTGSRFGADAMYQGENRNGGAIISYFINKEDKDSDAKKAKNDSIKLEIFDGNRQIRTLKFKAPKESGVHKTTWYLREKGVDRASRRIRKSTREPGGVTVKPGVYKLKMTYDDTSSEQNITVAFDPRLQISDEAINQKYNASKELESYQEKIAAIVKQLVESKNTASEIKKELSAADKDKYKDAIKSSKEIDKKIEDLIAIYLGSIDKRQGITRNPEITVNQRFGQASSYIRSRFGEQTATEKILMNQFIEEFKKAVAETNAFFNNDWIAYKKSVENINISPFKETKIYSAN